jgi:glycosyltransferase involved in cell wall biosynthesis
MTPSIRKFGRYFLLPVNNEKEALDFFSRKTDNVKKIKAPSSFLKKLSGDYLVLVDAEKEISIDKASLLRLIGEIRKRKAGLVYSGYYWREGKSQTPRSLIDCRIGSIRDDFDFGHFLIFSSAAVKSVLQKYGSLSSDAESAMYDLRLKISADYQIIRVPEFLYTVYAEKREKTKKSTGKTEAQFSYVAKENLRRQKKLEKIATSHLKRIGACLPPRTTIVNKKRDDRQWKASVIIPVLNRKKTIADALKSALRQKTDFPFNIIIVDNHSTDGTTDILRQYAAKYPHSHHMIPERRDLGIGGCWNAAINSAHCGNYAVQLDSDDLYSSSKTLQKIIDFMRRGNYAMVVGSYTIVNDLLKKIPPGLIAHREWTQSNGHNNLLRVNGMGAPRAFDTSVIRGAGFPNVSYGEDYAVALKISREYKIGRIYENLYWCRRWAENTDAGISAGKKNLNDEYKDELRSQEIRERQRLNERNDKLAGKTFAAYPEKAKSSLSALCEKLYDAQKKSWPNFAKACRDLSFVKTRELSGEYKVCLQYNPVRAVSSGAPVDAEAIKSRPCFLCQDNLPAEQKGILYRNQFLILCNPFPIFENHFTVASLLHEPQDAASAADVLMRLAADASPRYAVLYNGPACGASAPDHLHFQMVPRNVLPFLREARGIALFKKISSVEYRIGQGFDRCVMVMESGHEKALRESFLRWLDVAREKMAMNEEPMINMVCVSTRNKWRMVIFLRRKHRPDAYFTEGSQRMFVSPGAVDMAGVVITPLLDNYNRLDYNAVREIYREVSWPGSMMDAILKEL